MIINRRLIVHSIKNTFSAFPLLVFFLVFFFIIIIINISLSAIVVIMIIYIYIFIHSFIYIFIYIYIYIEICYYLYFSLKSSVRPYFPSLRLYVHKYICVCTCVYPYWLFRVQGVERGTGVKKRLYGKKERERKKRDRIWRTNANRES